MSIHVQSLFVPASRRLRVALQGPFLRRAGALATLLSLLLLPALCLQACGSTRSSSASGTHAKTGRPLRVLYVNYTSGKKFELVNESHSDRTQTYSSTKKLDEAYTKVTTDEVLDQVLVQFREVGYAQKAGAGSAPESGQGQALEVDDNGTVTSWVASKNSPADDQKHFLQCAKLFLDVYNNSYGLQAVDHAPDWQSQNLSNKKKKGQ